LITDQGIKGITDHAAFFSDLEQMFFGGNKITDAALASIGLKSNNFKNLR
jgi:hypothetical protein